MPGKTVEFSSLLNLNNHEMTVKDSRGRFWELVPYKNCPRADYKKVPSKKNPDVIHLVTIGIRHMPVANKKFNYVISRESLRAQKVLEKRILGMSGLNKFIKDYGLKGQEDFKAKIKFIGPNKLQEKWPEFHAWIDSLPDTEIDLLKKENLFKNMKKYVNRTDLYAPGPKGRDDKNAVTHCIGLIQAIDDDMYNEDG